MVSVVLGWIREAWSPYRNAATALRVFRPEGGADAFDVIAAYAFSILISLMPFLVAIQVFTMVWIIVKMTTGYELFLPGR